MRVGDRHYVLPQGAGTLARYFAVPDPLRPGSMSYWHRMGTGELVPWPLRHNRWDHVVVQPHEVPARGADHRWLAEYQKRHEERVQEAKAAVCAAIEADPVSAGTRFAVHQTLCFCCGRQLTEEQSKVYGIGPDCRRNVDANTLALALEITARLHAALTFEAGT